MAIKQKFSVLGLLISIILILLIVGGIVTLSNKNNQAIGALTFSMQHQNFQQNIALIKSQWMLENRPANLLFSFRDQRGNAVKAVPFSMSRKGWPLLTGERVEDCQVLLEKVTNTLLKESDNPVFKVAITQKEGDFVCQFCDAVNNATCFNYSVH